MWAVEPQSADGESDENFEKVGKAGGWASGSTMSHMQAT